MKFRSSGGSFAIISAYAPHAERPIEERRKFFHDVGEYFKAISCYGAKLLLGDFNSRLYFKDELEEHITDHFIKNIMKYQIKADANRYLLRELCASIKTIIVN